MSLEDKIKKILQAVNEEKDAPKDKDDDQDDDTKKNGADTDKDGDDTDLAKDSKKKDDACVKESVVPGTDALLGTKQSETLKQGAEEVSGSGKTAKLVAKYDKSTKQPKLPENGSGGSTDPKASEETSKIKANYAGGSMPKLKEEAINALFAGEELSEEFKLKAEAIFEAAVEEASDARVSALQEEYQQQLTEAVEEAKGELVEQIDGYLNHVVEQWMQDNAVALESGIKVEMVSSFMENMKSVFAEHYIDVPEDKIDVVAEQATQIEALEAEVQGLREAAERSEVEARILKCESIIKDASEGLTAIEAEKLKGLAENVEFETEEEFAGKVKALKESYFRKSPSKPAASQDPTPAAHISESKTHSDVEAVLKVLRQNDAPKIVRSIN